MNLTIEVDDAHTVIGILNDLLIYVDGLLNTVKNKLLVEIYIEVEKEIKKSPEYLAMQPGGELYAEIGNPNLHYDVEAIIFQVINSIEINIIKPKILGNEVYAELVINILKADFTDVLALNQASFTSANGEILPWLRWLLLEGDNKIVFGFNFSPNIGLDKSQTKGGIMVSGDTGWSIPSRYSGTINNNWLTRALEPLKASLERLVDIEFLKY